MHVLNIVHVTRLWEVSEVFCKFAVYPKGGDDDGADGGESDSERLGRGVALVGFSFELILQLQRCKEWPMRSYLFGLILGLSF